MLVRSSPEAVTTRTPRTCIARTPSSWAITERAKRLASSAITTRTPLPAIRWIMAAKPGLVSLGSVDPICAAKVDTPQEQRRVYKRGWY